MKADKKELLDKIAQNIGDLRGSLKCVEKMEDQLGDNYLTIYDTLQKRLQEKTEYWKFVNNMYPDVFRYESEKGKPLVSQYTKDVPVLTVEDSDKWYDLYLIMPTGDVRVVDWNLPDLSDGWRDHCIVPSSFMDLSRNNGWYVGWEVLDKVFEMYADSVFRSHVDVGI